MISIITSWLTTVSLIFGGCCSNAVTLEQLTLHHPKAGSVLTFFQFLLISLHGLPNFLTWTRLGPRFRAPRVPITQYLIQVGLFYLISLLNNVAFAYRIPMAVHIIFRSGGLIISMLLGWLVSGKLYTSAQIASVLFVTAGVVLTTLSASKLSSPAVTDVDPYTYATGIGILTLALIFSGFLGLLQDRTSTKYVKPSLEAEKVSGIPSGRPAPWQESMFFLHFLALPMFYPLIPDLITQMRALNTNGPTANFNLILPIKSSADLTTSFPLDLVPPYSLPKLPLHLFPQTENRSLLSLTQSAVAVDASDSRPLVLSFSIPHIYLPLVLNTITQLLCVAGVHRLTTSVSALTVTLILVVRKAVSLIISVVGVAKVGLAARDSFLTALRRVVATVGLEDVIQGWDHNRLGVDFNSIYNSFIVAFVGPDGTKPPQEFNEQMMWAGATMVLLGTIGYTIGSRSSKVKPSPKEKNE